jgi:hypothetical protein
MERQNKMLDDCHKYAAAINTKIQPFPTEPLIMSLLLSQHKMIDWLKDQVSQVTKGPIKKNLLTNNTFI